MKHLNGTHFDSFTRIYGTTITRFCNQSTLHIRKKLQFVSYIATEFFSMYEATTCIYFCLSHLMDLNEVYSNSDGRIQFWITMILQNIINKLPFPMHAA
jgi:hypothetical protein